jgi:hypothetical protein
MNSITFLNVTSCRMIKVQRRFGGKHCLHFQDQAFCLLGALFDPEDRSSKLLSNVGEVTTELHHVTSQKMFVFMVTAMSENIKIF